MAVPWKWRRFSTFRHWKQATTPMLLNTETGELVPFTGLTRPGVEPKSLSLSKRHHLTGNWVLRRRLTLPESTRPLFLTVQFLK